VDRGEMLNEPGDSWFSPKCLEGQPRGGATGGRALDGPGGVMLTAPNQTTKTCGRTGRVRRRGLSFVVERETAQTIS
jgi:hypothetical protein